MSGATSSTEATNEWNLYNKLGRHRVPEVNPLPLFLMYNYFICKDTYMYLYVYVRICIHTHKCIIYLSMHLSILTFSITYVSGIISRTVGRGSFVDDDTRDIDVGEGGVANGEDDKTVA